MRAGAPGRDAVLLARTQVGTSREPRDVRRPGTRHRRLFVRTSRTHLDARPVTSSPGHPRGRRRDRRVVVVDREQNGLEQHRLGEGRLHHREGGVGEVGLTLGVPPDVAGEPIVGEIGQRRLVDDVVLAEEVDLGVGEPERLDRLESAADTGDHSIATTLWQPSREQLEDRLALGRSGLERTLEHGQLVLVGEQRRGGRAAAGEVARKVAGEVGGGAHSATLVSAVHNEGVSTSPVELEEPEVDEVTKLASPWVTIVWNDPVNLMSYVTFVFQKYFGYPKKKARKLMLEVHEEGRSVVSTGSREEMERDVQAMHEYGLWATMQKADDK